MVKHLIEREIRKRLAIRIRRQNDPVISMRALAKEFRTSLRVVCDAMTRPVADWREMLEETMPRQIIAGKVPEAGLTRRPSSTSSIPSTLNEPDLDPDIDFDPDSASFED